MINHILEKTFSFFLNKKTEERICYFSLCLIIAIFSFFILFRANWIIGDDFETLQTTAIGITEHIGRHIGQEKVSNGRFYPLGHYDLNLLAFIPGAQSPLAHYIYICMQFILLIFLFWKTSGELKILGNKNMLSFSKENNDSKANLYLKTLALVILVCSSGFSWVFLDINYPERFLLILLTAFAFFLIKGIKTQKTSCFIISGIIAAYATYMKETVIGALTVIAIANLFFNKELTKKEKYFHFFLLINTLCFLIFYYFLAFRNHTSIYGIRNESSLYAISAVLMAEKTNIIIIAFAIFRLWKAILRNERKYLFTDSLLFGSAAYIISFAILKLYAPYYFIPALLLALPAIILTIYQINKPIIKISGFALLLLLSVLNIPSCFDNFSMSYVERTTHMPLIRTIAEHKENGGKLFWHIPQDISNNPINSTIAGQRHIYNVFIDFVNRKKDNSILPGRNENFEIFSSENELNLNGNDVVMIPLFASENGLPNPIPEQITKKLKHAEFNLITSNLLYVKIYMRKGSYIEKNWLLSHSGKI